jgi:hypothetical protein
MQPGASRPKAAHGRFLEDASLKVKLVINPDDAASASRGISSQFLLEQLT